MPIVLSKHFNHPHPYIEIATAISDSFFYHCGGLQAGWDREWCANPIPAGYGGVSHAVEEGYLGRCEITITKRRGTGTETVPGAETGERRRIPIACAQKSRGRVMPGWGML